MRKNLLVFFVLLICSGHGTLGLACDSSMLEILTGMSAQKQLTTRMLVVSQKMQQTGTLLNAFNIAAAAKMHQEVMENWLSITSQIQSQASEVRYSPIVSLLIAISQDLGQIRRQLESGNLDMIHEIIEVCITRISLACAGLNDHRSMRDFLEIELEIFQMRPHMNDRQLLKNKIDSSSLPQRLSTFLPETASAAPAMIADMTDNFNKIRNALSETDLSESAVQNLMQSLVSQFIALKQYLLNANFFKQ